MILKNAVGAPFACKEYDYTLLGMYFVTGVTHNQTSIFGDVVDGVMQLNTRGKIVHNEWMQSADLRPHIE